MLKFNEKRWEAGLSLLYIKLVDLAECGDRQLSIEEEKISLGFGHVLCHIFCVTRDITDRPG